MTSLKRGGTRKKGVKKATNSWKDPMASLKISDNMSRRREDVEDVNQYIDQLNTEERLWMAKFMTEYNNAALDYKDLSNNLHNTPELKKACTDRNNARNRCIYTREKAKGMLNYAGSDSELEAFIHENKTTEDFADIEENVEEESIELED